MWSYPSSAISRISATTDSVGRALNRSPNTDLWHKSQRTGDTRVDISGVVASSQRLRQQAMYGSSGRSPRRAEVHEAERRHDPVAALRRSALRVDEDHVDVLGHVMPGTLPMRGEGCGVGTHLVRLLDVDVVCGAVEFRRENVVEAGPVEVRRGELTPGV